MWIVNKSHNAFVMRVLRRTSIDSHFQLLYFQINLLSQFINRRTKRFMNDNVSLTHSSRAYWHSRNHFRSYVRRDFWRKINEKECDHKHRWHFFNNFQLEIPLMPFRLLLLSLFLCLKSPLLLSVRAGKVEKFAYKLNEWVEEKTICSIE